MTPNIFRWILTALLIYGVYTETGGWTALFCVYVAVSLELVVSTLREMAGLNSAMTSNLVRVADILGRRAGA